MNEKDQANKIIQIVENGVAKFEDGINATQKNIFQRVNNILRRLDVKNSKVLVNRDNLRLLRRLNEELRSVIVTDAYKKKLNTYLLNFDRLKRSNDGYFNPLITGYNPNKQSYKTILNLSLEATKESLLFSGIDSNVINPVDSILRQGITQGMFIDDLEDVVRVDILGDPDGSITGTPRKGNLARYTKQITRDALNQFSRNYVTTVSEDNDMVWYYYDGSIIEDTRSYCSQRAGKYFHKDEVEKSANDKWAGKIKGTNRSTIFTYCGGYNCRHTYLPTLIDVVPNRVVRRNIKNGNYEPSN